MATLSSEFSSVLRFCPHAGVFRAVFGAAGCHVFDPAGRIDFGSDSEYDRAGAAFARVASRALIAGAVGNKRQTGSLVPG